jgi:ribonuclease P protein component
MHIRPAKGTRAVREVFAGPLRITSGPLAATITLAEEPVPAISVVITVGKARVRKAVDRNRIKRVMRHVVRDIFGTRPPEKVPYLAAMVVVWRSVLPETGIRTSDVRRHMQRLVERLECAPSSRPRGAS